MPRFNSIVLNVGIAFMLLASAALAQDASTIAAAAVANGPPPDTVVVVPYGNWLDEVIKIAQGLGALVITGLVGWVLTFLPKTLATYVSAGIRSQVEQLLLRAVDYGLNAVAGAVKGKTLQVDVGSQVVAEAAQYVVDHGPSKLVDMMGGEQGIKEKIVARLDLAPEATAGEVLANTQPTIQK